MRIPVKLKPKRAKSKKPERFRSIRFEPCLRCMGHGLFQTDPPERIPMTAFSKEGALGHLIHLAEAEQVSKNQYAVLETQILMSSLPDEVPKSTEDFVNACLDKEVALSENLVSSDPDDAESPRRLFIDLGEVVHEFLLGPKGPPELKAQ